MINQKILFRAVILLCLTACIAVQITQIQLVADTRWLLHIGQRFLAGGDYHLGFVDANPPMAFLLYLPILGITKLMHFSWLHSYYIFCLFTIGPLLIFNTRLVKQHYLHDPARYAVTTISYAICFLVIAGQAFAEREFFVVLLQLPYCYLTLRRCERQAVSSRLAASIALMMSVAIMIKPFYGAMWLSMEAYRAYQCRALQLSRIEILVIPATLLAYVVFCLWATPNYIPFIQHIALPFYYSALMTPWSLFFIDPVFIYVGTTLTLYALLRKQYEVDRLTDVFAIAMLTVMSIFVFQNYLAFYHFYPCYVFSSLVLAKLTYEVCQHESFYDRAIACLMMGVMLIFGIYLTMTYSKSPKSYRVSQQVVSYLKAQTPGKAYFISAFIHDSFPTLDRLPIPSTTRYAHLWPLIAVMRGDFPSSHAITGVQRQRLIGDIVDDFLSQNPDTVFVDKFQYPTRKGTFSWPYLKCLQEDPRFKNRWQAYRQVGKINTLIIYKKQSAQ